MSTGDVLISDRRCIAMPNRQEPNKNADEVITAGSVGQAFPGKPFTSFIFDWVGHSGNFFFWDGKCPVCRAVDDTLMCSSIIFANKFQLCP